MTDAVPDTFSLIVRKSGTECMVERYSVCHCLQM